MDLGSEMARRLWGRRRREQRQKIWIAGAAAAGAGAMYFLDPDRGARRRALARDKSVHALHQAAGVVDKAARDLGYRTHGMAAGARALLRHEVVGDDVLVQRVRSRMGRCVSHPHAVQVSAAEGTVTLRGQVLAGEEKALLSCVARVPGVTMVDDRLEVHAQGEGVPSLQGAPRGPGARSGRWSPAVRVTAAAAGGGLLAWGIARRGRAGAVVAGAGAALLCRDVADRPIRRLLGIGAERTDIDLHKTITVRAPIGEVFALFSQVESFPRFMSHVREVRRMGDGRYRWVVGGPGGVPVAWDAEITEMVPERLLAWRSLPGEAVQHFGVARFEEIPGGATRLDIRMSYGPPGGMVGHLVAKLCGADPKRAMDEDLVRFQSMLERGKTTAHGDEVRRADLSGAAAPESGPRLR
jgi:uncharacterized membrane protein